MRLGHPGKSVLSLVLNKQSPSKTISSKFVADSFDVCNGCPIGKNKRLPFELYFSRSSSPFHLIHSDAWKSPVKSFHGFEYYLLLMIMVVIHGFFHSKESLKSLKNSSSSIIKWRIFSTRLLTFNLTMEEVSQLPVSFFFQQVGIHHRMSCPHTAQQNGVAEQKHQHIANVIRSSLL